MSNAPGPSSLLGDDDSSGDEFDVRPARKRDCQPQQAPCPNSNPFAPSEPFTRTLNLTQGIDAQGRGAQPAGDTESAPLNLLRELLTTDAAARQASEPCVPL